MNDSSPQRPFCSKRCRDIDFGDWATESFAIEGDSVESDAWSEDMDDGRE